MRNTSLVDDERVRRAATALAAVLAFYYVIQRFWPSPLGVLLQGLVLGGLTALIAFGIALVYRANRIVNFAQGDLGALPASLAVLLIVGPGLPYFVALPIGLAAGVALGALVDFLIIRRFFKSPRLVLTVVTIGLSQLLGGLGFILPQAFDITTPPQSFPSPFDFTMRVGRTVFSGNDIVAMVAVVLLISGLGAFFKYTNIGIAVRASAEGAERASLLGVPVKRIETIVWIIAALLATTGVFLRAGVVGLPFGQLVGPAVLLRALTAAVIGKMERFSTILIASLALGVVESAVIFRTGRATLVDPILFVVIIAAMVLRKAGAAARTEERSSWQASSDVRPIPRELVHLPEVKWGVFGTKAALAGVALGLPILLSESQVNLAAVIVMYAIVGVSLVVLTGWAGQVSLGQFAFFGIGAAVASHFTTALDWDLSVAVVMGGFAGAVAATLIGIPALRIKGLYLAVTTLAFALATTSFLLNPEFLHWLPQGRFDRPRLFERIALDTEIRFYYLSLAVLLLAIGAVRSLRRSRTGRVLIGVRDNERAAQSYGVNVTAAKLTAFAMSGFMAAVAGGLFVHHQQTLSLNSYGVSKSFQVFIEVVIGGLGSPMGAIIGVVVIEGVRYFQNLFPETLRQFLDFFTGPVGLIFVLLVLRGGLSQVVYIVRDRLLRTVAERRQILVPSLLADARERGADELDEDAVLTSAAVATGAELHADEPAIEPVPASRPEPPPDVPPRTRAGRRVPLRAGAGS